MQIRPIDSSIIVEVSWNMEVSEFLAIGIANNIAQPPIVHSLRSIFWVPDHLVDEISKVQDEIQTVIVRRSLIFENHPSIGVLRTLIDILATYEGKLDRSAVARIRGGNGSPYSASHAAAVTEAIPINV